MKRWWAHAGPVKSEDGVGLIPAYMVKWDGGERVVRPDQRQPDKGMVGAETAAEIYAASIRSTRQWLSDPNLGSTATQASTDYLVTEPLSACPVSALLARPHHAPAFTPGRTVHPAACAAERLSGTEK